MHARSLWANQEDGKWVAQKERRRETDEKKKRPKTKKDPMTKKFAKKIILVSGGLVLTAFLKGPWGCPLDHGYLLIRALRPNFDLPSIHIGRFSNTLSWKMTKKRVLQRVLRYYHGSTGFGCYHDFWVYKTYFWVYKTFGLLPTKLVIHNPPKTCLERDPRRAAFQ